MNNLMIFDAEIKCLSVIKQHENILVSLSGGSDSDIMLDLIVRTAQQNNVALNKFHFVFFDTGIEYKATKDHLSYLEQRYGINIERMRAITPVPLGARKYGLPFLSKHVSEMISRLQKHGFMFENEPFDVLINKYPRCKVALQWWCNNNQDKSRFNIDQNKYLKEFMVQNPPDFLISNKCCKGAKKENAYKILKTLDCDLNCVGIRKAEGGARAAAYKTCFSSKNNKEKYDNYRPIFWFVNKDKEEYEQEYGIKHSDCYCKYGLKRTGCVGCPFGRDFENELEVVQKFEPKLYNAVSKIFNKSYEYTRKYKEFVKQKKRCLEWLKQVTK